MWFLEDRLREFRFSQTVIENLWKRFPVVFYESLQEEGDDLWGDDLSEDDSLWGGDLGGTAGEQKELHAFISDSTFFARRIGFEAIKDVVIVIPDTFLKESGITPKRGDKIYSGESVFSVSDVMPFGFWRTTVHKLYTALNCRLI